MTLTPSPASRPKTSPMGILSSSPSSRAPWCSEEPRVYNILILSEALHGNCINYVELFWTKSFVFRVDHSL